MDSSPLVKIHIVGALDEGGKFMLTRGIAGDFEEEDNSHDFSGLDIPEDHYEDDDAEEAGNDFANDEPDSDNSHKDGDNDENTTDSDDYYDEDDPPAFNKVYVEYGPEDGDVIGSRKRYIHARFDNQDHLSDPSALSPLAQRHHPTDQSRVVVRYIKDPLTWWRIFPIENQHKLGISLLRTSERIFTGRMIHAYHPFYLVNHPMQQCYEDPKSKHEAPFCLYRRLQEGLSVVCDDHEGDYWLDSFKAIVGEGYVDEDLAEEWQGRYDASIDVGISRREYARDRIARRLA
ncbi:MAG: hypothetical protein Q9228_007765 [Teloschistes exilis]